MGWWPFSRWPHTRVTGVLRAISSTGAGHGSFSVDGGAGTAPVVCNSAIAAEVVCAANAARTAVSRGSSQTMSGSGSRNVLAIAAAAIPLVDQPLTGTRRYL